jgi:sugar phosphate isomerase/epimerase
MKVLFFCPRWGQSHLGWDDFAYKVKAAGYDGIETDIPIDASERAILLEAMDKHGLLLIAQHWETVAPDYEQHKTEYAARIAHLAAAKPLFINSQTGKDYYSFEQNKHLLALAAATTAGTGVEVYHETHRGKFSFAAHITHEYLKLLSGLEITLDISHWCAVAETLLHDQAEAVKTAISRTRHVHARVGFAQGPQVNDPRAPEWKEALDFHLHCWDAVVELHKKMQRPVLSFTMEFGPFPYMPQHPYTQQPLSDQWEINWHMKEMLKKRYEPAILQAI